MHKRIEALQTALPPKAALLIESTPNRLYLTGFASSAGFVLLSRERAAFYIDFRYIEAAKAAVSHLPVTLSERPMEEVRSFLAAEGLDTLYVESDTTSLDRAAALRSALDGVTLATDDAYSRKLTAMRQIKTPAELARIRQAQQLTDDTFAAILPRIAVGRTERDIMLDMEFAMRRMGSEGVAFDFIVVSGKNSALPHGVPTDKPLEAGDFLTMDFGAVVDGYRADMTRTVVLTRVDDTQRRVYDTVLAAQTAALAAIRPSAVCADVDKIARDLIHAAGYEGCFGHGLGHSVGIDIHESPSFSPRCTTPLQEGMVMTVEPGIYLAGRYGVRIEDMVVVTADGCDDLTHSSKELIIL